MTRYTHHTNDKNGTVFSGSLKCTSQITRKTFLSGHLCVRGSCLKIVLLRFCHVNIKNIQNKKKKFYIRFLEKKVLLMRKTELVCKFCVFL